MSWSRSPGSSGPVGLCRPHRAGPEDASDAPQCWRRRCRFRRSRQGRAATPLIAWSVRRRERYAAQTGLPCRSQLRKVAPNSGPIRSAHEDHQPHLQCQSLGTASLLARAAWRGLRSPRSANSADERGWYQGVKAHRCCFLQRVHGSTGRMNEIQMGPQPAPNAYGMIGHLGLCDCFCISRRCSLSRWPYRPAEADLRRARRRWRARHPRRLRPRQPCPRLRLDVQGR